MKTLSKVLAAAAGLGLIFSGSAVFAADDVDAGVDSQSGSCVRPGSNIWSPAGAYSVARADDRITWESSKHAVVNYSNGSGSLYGCNNGAVYGGGQKRISFDSRITGQGISSCGIGGCAVSDQTATFNDSSGWTNNGNGQVTFTRAGGDVWARDLAGQLNYFDNTVTVEFRYNGSVTQARVTHNWKYGD